MSFPLFRKCTTIRSRDDRDAATPAEGERSGRGGPGRSAS